MPTCVVMSVNEMPGNGEARVVIRNGRLTLTRRPHYLMQVRMDRYRGALRDAGTVVCDVELNDSPSGERELTVTRSFGSELDDAATDVLIEWAALIGCRRVWLADRLVDLGDLLIPAVEDIATEPCPTCGVTVDEATLMDELLTLRRRGPVASSTCPACLSARPQRLARTAAD